MRREQLIEHVTASIESARFVDTPFPYLDLDHIFPDDTYTTLLAAMPDAVNYRPMHGRSRRSDLSDGTHTRTKIDLLPEFVRHFRGDRRDVWQEVGDALRSEPVKQAFVRRLAPGLSRRFGDGYTHVAFYPLPILTRDVPGYQISPHTDTLWKGITVQLYLPRDESAVHVGTIFHERLADGTLVRRMQMRFAPNTGYAFAVGNNTWHSVDPVGSEVATRDSILLTYFVDSGLLRVMRNRFKRIGNLLLNEVNSRTRLSIG